MTAFEFLTFQPTSHSRQRADSYEQLICFMRIEKILPQIREDSKYKQTYQILSTFTTALDRDKAVECLSGYKINAIAYGIETKDLDWRIFFVAAYDLWKDTILGQRKDWQ